MQKHHKIILLILMLSVVLSCRVLTSEEIPTPSGVTESPKFTMPAFTNTPLVPTNTPAPIGLNTSGPYVVYEGAGGIWISNPDGSFLTQLTDLGSSRADVDLRAAISPQGDRLALIVGNDEGLDLVEIRIPGGETRTITHLFSITHDELVSEPLSARAFAAYAIRDYNNVAWQPGEGKLLAFMGALNGPTSDLYVYNTETEEITQLTDGQSQGVFPTWSPDGKHILHYGVSWRGPFGGAIVGHDHLDGVWAVRVEDGKVITMPTPKSVAIPFLGWQDEEHYITYDGGDDCAGNLRSVDVSSGKTIPIMDSDFYYYIARSDENGAILFSESPDCAESLGEGTFLLPPGETTPIKLADKRAWTVRWLPESQVFFAYPEALFSADGNTRYDPPVYDNSFKAAVSQQGYQAWEVIESPPGRVDVKVPGEDWQKILEGTVEALIWDPISGETLLIAMREGSLYAASYPDFIPYKMGEMDGVNQMIWLP